MQITATAYTDTNVLPEETLSPAWALDRLLARHQAALRAQGIDQRVERLKRLLHMLHRDGAAASDTGEDWLTGICDCLQATLEARRRMEEEGTAPFSKKHFHKNEALAATIGRLKRILNHGSAEIIPLQPA